MTHIDTQGLLRLVAAINRRISIMDDTDTLLEVIVDSMIEHAGADRGYILITEGKKRVTARKAREGLAEREISWEVAETTRTSGRPTVTDAILCTPLLINNQPAGVVYLDTDGRFSDQVIEGVQILATQASIVLSPLSCPLKITPLSRMKQDFEKRAIEQALTATNWNIAAASRMLSVARPQLSRLVKKYNLCRG